MKENPVIRSDYHLLVLGRREVGWENLISNAIPLFFNRRSVLSFFLFFFPLKRALGLGDIFWLLLVSKSEEPQLVSSQRMIGSAAFGRGTLVPAGRGRLGRGGGNTSTEGPSTEISAF